MKSISVDCPDNQSPPQQLQVDVDHQQPNVTAAQRMRREHFRSNKSVSLDPDWLNSRAKESSVANANYVHSSVRAVNRFRFTVVQTVLINLFYE